MSSTFLRLNVDRTALGTFGFWVCSVLGELFFDPLIHHFDDFGVEWLILDGSSVFVAGGFGEAVEGIVDADIGC